MLTVWGLEACRVLVSRSIAQILMGATFLGTLSHPPLDQRQLQIPDPSSQLSFAGDLLVCRTPLSGLELGIAFEWCSNYVWSE